MPTAAYLMTHLSTRCVWIASDYLILPHRLHRWFALVVSCVIALLIGCFIAFAFAEKHHLENAFFYGRLEFSFVDGGYPELFAYGLELLSCTIFLWVAWAYHKAHWYAWAGILFVIFLDDAFKLHETIGHVLGSELGLPSVVSDLIGFASTGLLSMVFWVLGIRVVKGDDELCAYFVFTAYFAILIFFGVGVDAMHGLLGSNTSQTLLTLIEDGGELLMTAVMNLSALGMWLRQRQPMVADNMPINSIFSKTVIK